MYFDVISLLFERDCRYIPECFDLSFIVENNSVDDIMKKIDVINRFIVYFKFNVNVSLFLDNFVISLEER